MAINKDNPLRPLLLAVNAARILGVVYLAIGLLLLLMIQGVGAPGRAGLGRWVMIGVLAFFLIGPGILYLVFATFMRRFQRWAVIATLVVASLQAAVLASNLISGLVLTTLLFLALLFVASALLIFYCARSFRVIREDGPRREVGFEPLMPVPVPVPVQPLSAAPPESGDTVQGS